ncbi:MAG: ribonuclease III [Lachnospiraceae bacterium]|nr:ribonuclease III [Lachnospiraceae bacterium]MDD7024942.1 ribonuclease III [Oscillospiraceae bacterium]MDY5541692.1 ribonuclease III [Lachnospiraceae bacterium]MDY5648776.1 ribonuclease III [Lachnospiraceae bacterium]
MLKEEVRKELEEKIRYHFRNPKLMEKALTHSSYSNEHRLGRLENNERLEFLGDAVLEIVTSEFLYRTYPQKPEGELTKLRASMVCEQTLAFCARALDLGSYLLLGKGEDLTGGRERASVTSDAMEAMIGAVYLDGGFANAKEFVHHFVLNDIEHKQLFFDSKTILQEIVQGELECEPVYELVGEEGPNHNKKFLVQVSIKGAVFGRGSGRTKKAAEQEAAYAAILKLKTEK